MKSSDEFKKISFIIFFCATISPVWHFNFFPLFPKLLCSIKKISFIYLFRETISAGFFQFYFPLQDVQQSSPPGFKKLQLAPPARIPLCKYSSFKEIPQNWVAMDQQVSPDTMVRELWKSTFLKLHQVLATVIQKPSNLEKLFFFKMRICPISRWHCNKRLIFSTTPSINKFKVSSKTE